MKMTAWCRIGVALAAFGATVAASGFKSPAPESKRDAPVAGDTTLNYTPADVEFVQGMIQHHAQALVMAALVPSRTKNKTVRSLAQRIDISQRDEIKLMSDWLSARHQSVPSVDVHPSGAAPAMQMDMPGMLMPGMLTQTQMAQLAKARNAAFDRLFLRFMIQHHEGALLMVKNLFASQGAGQAPEVFSLASDIDSGQRAEIARMRALLDSGFKRRT
jgi:uncharacterized protein (DUF305 family)